MFERFECLDDSTRRAETDGANRSEGATAEPVSGRCDHCDDPIATDEWHPVVTRRDDDGDVTIYGFCSEACRERWERECDGAGS